MKNSFDRIITSVPLNATAGRVVSKGVHYEPDLGNTTERHSDICPPVIPIPRISVHSCGDLPGRKFGRLTVIGLGVPVHSKQGSDKPKWVCRCACGVYVYRRAKVIRNPLNIDDCCLKCCHLKRINDKYKNLGSKPLSAFIGDKA